MPVTKDKTPENTPQPPAHCPVLLAPAKETAPSPAKLEEIENGCMWCDAEQCLHHHTYELP